MTDLKHIQEDTSLWGRETFDDTSGPSGPRRAQRIAGRMNVEVAELLDGFNALPDAAPGSEDYRERIHGLGMECADVAIMLVQVAEELGVCLDTYLQLKMIINRKRTWEQLANGRVQHVENPALVLAEIALANGDQINEQFIAEAAQKLETMNHPIYEESDNGKDDPET